MVLLKSMAPPVPPAELPVNLRTVAKRSVIRDWQLADDEESGHWTGCTITALQRHVTHVESSTTRLPLPTEMAPPNCVTMLRLKVEPLMVVSVLLSSSTEAPSPMLLPAVSGSQVVR